MKKNQLLFYFIFGSIAWISGTNLILDQFERTPFIEAAEHIKELIYVIAAGGLFYFSMKKTEELQTTKMEEQRLSTLINSMVDFVNFKDGEGRWIQANDYGLNLFQLTGVDYRGKKDSELAEYSADYADALRFCEMSDEETWQNGKITRVEEVLSNSKGETRIFDTIKVPLFHPDGSRKGLVIIGRDVTEKHRLVNLLEESRQQYKSLFEYSPDIVYMTDLKGRFTNLNSRFKEVTGYAPETVIGRNARSLLPKKYRRQLRDYLTIVVNEKKPQFLELDFKTKDGRQIILECTSLPIIINGEAAGMIGYGRDVTKMRETEEQLVRSEKLSIVGELSASVAHEIRNPLTSLLGFVHMLKAEDPRHQFYYSIMGDELNRINDIVGELLLLAKPQQVQFIKADLQEIVRNVISLLQTEAALRNIKLDFHPSANKALIECEPNQLKQLFINIIKNAIEASASGGVVSVSVSETKEGLAGVCIEDEGTGISRELLGKLGEPFYSSKEKGTGLGLTVSFKIVEAHHGKMTFESEVDKGTKVNIALPAKINSAPPAIRIT